MINCYDLLSSHVLSILIKSLWVLLFMLNCLFFSKQMAKASCFMWLYLISSWICCSHSDICFIGCLSFPKQQGNVSHLNLSEIVHKDPIERYRSVLEAEVIDWDSFDFNGVWFCLYTYIICWVFYDYYCLMGSF